MIDLDAIKDRLGEYDAVWPGLEDSKATWWATRLYEAAGDLLAEVERLRQRVAELEAVLEDCEWSDGPDGLWEEWSGETDD